MRWFTGSAEGKKCGCERVRIVLILTLYHLHGTLRGQTMKTKQAQEQMSVQERTPLLLLLTHSRGGCRDGLNVVALGDRCLDHGLVVEAQDDGPRLHGNCTFVRSIGGSGTVGSKSELLRTL